MEVEEEAKVVFSRVLRDSIPRAVHPSVGWLVGWSLFYIFFTLRSSASLLRPKCSSYSNIAPAHPHATGIAVYPALFSFFSPFFPFHIPEPFDSSPPSRGEGTQLHSGLMEAEVKILFKMEMEVVL